MNVGFGFGVSKLGKCSRQRPFLKFNSQDIYFLMNAMDYEEIL